MTVLSRNSRIEAVLFELEGTIVDTCDLVGWADAARSVGLELDPEDFARALANDSTESEYIDNAEEYWRALLGIAVGRSIPSDVVRAFLRQISQRRVSKSLYSDVRKCLSRLRADHRRLAAISLSLTESAVRELFARVNILGFFGVVVAQAPIGPPATEAELLGRAASQLGLDPPSILYVRANMRLSIGGASPTIGMSSVWLNRWGTGEGRAVLQTLSLSEVPRVARELDGTADVK